MPMTNYAGPIPAVPHLHGGEVPPELDGGPDAWFLSQGETGYMMHATPTTAWDRLPGPRITVSTATRTSRNRPPSGSTTTRWASPVERLRRARRRLPDQGPGRGPPDRAGPAWPQPQRRAELHGAIVIQDRMFDVNGQLFLPEPRHQPDGAPLLDPEFVGIPS